MSKASETILITGGAGFIGSHLAARLLKSGRRVLILDDLSTGKLTNLAPIAEHSRLKLFTGSVMDHSLVARVAAEADVVVHLASVVGVQLILEHPLRTIETNIRGTEHVLSAAATMGKRVILASTSEVYGKSDRYPFREDDDIVLGSTSKIRWAYAASKMIDEFLCLAYHQEHGLNAIPVRFFNTVGTRQTGRYGMVLPRLVRQALRGESLTVYGDGTQQRCFCDVRDVVRALVGLIEHPHIPVQIYNIGGTEEVTILTLAERVKAISKSKSPIRFIPYEEAYPPGFEDMQRRIPDTTRIRDLIGWAPELTLDDIISSVVEYERCTVLAGELQ